MTVFFSSLNSEHILHTSALLQKLGGHRGSVARRHARPLIIGQSKVWPRRPLLIWHQLVEIETCKSMIEEEYLKRDQWYLVQMHAIQWTLGWKIDARIVIIGRWGEARGKLKLAAVRVKLFRDHAIQPFRVHAARRLKLENCLQLLKFCWWFCRGCNYNLESNTTKIWKPSVT